jgi:hypothetical protein
VSHTLFPDTPSLQVPVCGNACHTAVAFCRFICSMPHTLVPELPVLLSCDITHMTVHRTTVCLDINPLSFPVSFLLCVYPLLIWYYSDQYDVTIRITFFYLIGSPTSFSIGPSCPIRCVDPLLIWCYLIGSPTSFLLAPLVQSVYISF